MGGQKKRLDVIRLPCRLVWWLLRSVDCGKCRDVENPSLQIGHISNGQAPGSPSGDVTLGVDIVPPEMSEGKVESTSKSETMHEGPGVSISLCWWS